MIERQFISQNIKEFLIQEHVTKSIDKVGHSHTKMQKTPLGEKISIFASRPGLIVGRKGENIKKLTFDLKKIFNLENPQIEINEVDNVNLDAQIVAERIASSLERFGSSKFKGIGHKTMSDVLGAGALGIEILVSGKIPSARAKTWRFYQGYLKKSGDISLVSVRKAYSIAQLKSGIVGIQVRIMPPDLDLPDQIELVKEPEILVEEIKETIKSEGKEAPHVNKSKKSEKPKKEEKADEEKKENAED